jgi:hypothetical protein
MRYPRAERMYPAAVTTGVAPTRDRAFRPE